MKNILAKKFTYILLVLFVGACLVTTLHAVNKHSAIAYDFDYGYYVQIATKLFDPQSAHVTTMVPIGANMFGLGAFEGVKGYHKTIHFELMKYFPALVFFISGHLWVIFLAVAIGYFSPLLYLLVIFKNKDSDEKYKAFVYGLLYTFSPAVLATVTFDLRVSFIYMAPFILLLFLAVYYRRSFWEICLFFNLLFIVREEALVYTAIFIIYYFFRHHILGSRPAKYFIALIVNWLAWAGIIFVFMKWSGYGLTDKNIVRLNTLSTGLYHYWIYLLILFIVFGILGLKLYQRLRNKNNGFYIRLINDIFLLGALSAPILFWVGKKMPSSMNPLKLLYFPRFILLLPIIFIMGLIIGFSYIKSEKQKIRFNLAITLVAGLMFFLNFLPVNEAAATDWSRAKSKISDARLVWDLVASTDKYNTVVLADLPTLEAFYDFEQINIFPCSAPNDFNLVQRDEPIRCYPGNEKYLVDLIKNKVEYIVITKNSLSLVSDLMLQAQVKALESKTNDTYAWIRLSKNK